MKGRQTKINKTNIFISIVLLILMIGGAFTINVTSATEDISTESTQTLFETPIQITNSTYYSRYPHIRINDPDLHIAYSEYYNTSEYSIHPWSEVITKHTWIENESYDWKEENITGTRLFGTNFQIDTNRFYVYGWSDIIRKTPYSLYYKTNNRWNSVDNVGLYGAGSQLYASIMSGFTVEGKRAFWLSEGEMTDGPRLCWTNSSSNFDPFCHREVDFQDLHSKLVFDDSDETLHCIAYYGDKLVYMDTSNYGHTWENTYTIADEEIDGFFERMSFKKYQENLFLFYPDSKYGGIYFSYSHDNGYNWDKFKLMEEGDNPQASIDSNGHIHLVWHENKQIYYQVIDKNGETVVDKQNISEPGIESEYPSIDIDYNDVPHIAWQANKTGYYDIFYTTYKKPEIYHTSPEIVKAGKIYYINATIFGNVDASDVLLYYKTQDQTTYNLIATMEESNGRYTTDLIAPEDDINIYYYIWVKDINGAHNKTRVQTIRVYTDFIDIAGPDIIHTPISKVDAGKEITIMAEIQDESDVSSAAVFYKFDNGTEYSMEKMEKSGDKYFCNISIPDDIDFIGYYIWANDSFNNENTTDRYNIFIKNVDEGSTEDGATKNKEGFIPGTELGTSIIITILIIVACVIAIFKIYSIRKGDENK